MLSPGNVPDPYQSMLPRQRGISKRSVRRYCKDRSIHRLTDRELDVIVGDFLELYGHGYGRSMMQGSIRARLGVLSCAVSQRRVARSLQRPAPMAYEARARDLLERTDPIPYYAPYFGYKCHIDQNENIAQTYGCTHVALLDGCSRMICGFASMQVKNPILIYEFVFRPALLKFGCLWDQLRLDHGREFVLCIFVQDLLKYYRRNKQRAAWRQTASTDNYVIERFWPELNSRVNYPVKRAMARVIEEQDYDLSDPILSYCVSWISLFITQGSAKHLIDAWNHHRVPGALGCIPIENMRQTKSTSEISEGLIPTTPEAVRM